MDIKLIITVLLITILWGCNHAEQQPKDAYIVQDIELPKGLGGQVGGLDFLPDGRLATCFSSGEIMFYSPKRKKWHLYATGLHDPLGILAVSKDTILVMQRPELTRIIDSDGDGKGDVFETVIDGFGISGNYHEFAYGPVKDEEGNLYIALNAASPNGTEFKEVRGELNPLTMAHFNPKQMYSPVPYRGWILKYTPQGKLIPYASGFRSPNGLVIDGDNNLFVTDNQGDWVPTSPLYLIKKGHFYGHPASLVWKKDWNKGNPYKIPVERLDSMRNKGVVLFPQGIAASSPTQPIFDNTEGKFGPFRGQMFVGEMNIPRILRIMLDTVKGHIQGATIPFIDSMGLYKGNNRLAFAPDGSLWVGQNDHGWAGHRGIQRIFYTGKVPMEVKKIHLTATGFNLTFTLPLNSDSVLEDSQFKIRHFNYRYSPNYGSKQYHVKDVSIQSLHLSKDQKTVHLIVDSLKRDMIYQITFSNIRSKEGKKLRNSVMWYTLNYLN